MSRRAQLIGLFGVLIVAAVLRLWQINHIPPGFHYDESFEGVEAWRILTDPAYRPIFLTGDFGIPPLNTYANVLTFIIFGWLGGQPGPTAMRVTAACFGILGVLGVYAVAVELRRLAAPKTRFSAAFPLLAAASLAVMRWHIQFSRTGIEAIIVPVIWSGAIWLFLRGWRTGRWPDFALCGVLLAAGMYTYLEAWVIPILMVLIAGRFLMATRKLQPNHPTTNQLISEPSVTAFFLRRWRGLLIAATVSALLIVPLAWFFWNDPTFLVMRPTQVFIGSQPSQVAPVSVWHNMWVTLKMFGPFGAPGDLDPRRNIPGAPALNFWLAIPFYIGLIIALRRVWRPVNVLVLISLAGLLLPGVFAVEAPHFNRVLGATAPTAVLCGFGLDAIWQGFDRLQPSRVLWPRWQALRTETKTLFLTLAHSVAIFLVVGGGALSAYHYFVTWATRPDLFYAFDVGLWQVGQWVAAHENGDPFYISPQGIDHRTLAFAWRASPKPVEFDGRHIFPLDGGKTAIPEHYVVFEYQDFRTHLLLPEVFPTATIDKEFIDSYGRVDARV